MPGKTKAEIEALVRDVERQREQDAKGPKVWHRDASQPTFARVYVGDGNSLELVSLQVTVTIDGPRARTLVDHVFRNPHDRQLEGTFEYPLPTGSQPQLLRHVPRQYRPSRAAALRPPRRQAPCPPTPSPHCQPADGSSHVNAADWGMPRRPASSARTRASKPTRRSSAAASTRPCSNTPAATPSAAASSRSRPRATTASSSPMRNCCRSAGDSCCIASPAGLQARRHEVHLAGQRRSCARSDFAVKEAKNARRRQSCCFSDLEGRKAQRRCPLHLHPGRSRICRPSAAGSSDGPLHVYARVRPELQAERTAPFAARRLPARHVAERASGPLQRQH